MLESSLSQDLIAAALHDLDEQQARLYEKLNLFVRTHLAALQPAAAQDFREMMFQCLPEFVQSVGALQAIALAAEGADYCHHTTS